MTENPLAVFRQVSADEFEAFINECRQENPDIPERGTNAYWDVVLDVAPKLGVSERTYDDLYEMAAQAHAARAVPPPPPPKLDPYNGAQIV